MPEVDIGEREVIQALMVAPVVVVLDEGAELGFEITGQIIVLEQDTVLQRLVPALDLVLGLGMVRCATDMRRGSAARTARAGDASQMVRGPLLPSGNTARSPCTCSHRSCSASTSARRCRAGSAARRRRLGGRLPRRRAPPERGELAVRQVARLEPRLAPPQSPVRVGVLGSLSERLGVLH